MKGVLHRMINTHEINLNTSAFNRFVNSDYVILQSSEIEVNDYILFKQVETSPTAPDKSDDYSYTYEYVGTIGQALSKISTLQQ